MSRPAHRRRLAACATSGLLLGLLPIAAGSAPAPLAQRIHSVEIDSGVRANHGVIETVVFTATLDVGEAPWVRVLFDEVELGEGSYLHLTSQRDGRSQVLDAGAVHEWERSSAYFTGPAVVLELVAGPRTTANRVAVRRVLAGDRPAIPSGLRPRRVCNAMDDTRTRSSNAATARLLAQNGGGCTGFIIDRAPADDPFDRCMVSAGHCFVPGVGDHQVSDLVQFEVDDSKDCDPGTSAKQFHIDAASVKARNNGRGDDWAVFRVARNSGKTAFEEQRAQFALAEAVASGPAYKYGYGLDGSGPSGNPLEQDGNCWCDRGDIDAHESQIQQGGSGTVTYPSQTGLSYVVDHDLPDCRGDSGEPIIDLAGRVVAIGTHGFCAGTTRQNHGTAIAHPDLLRAIAEVCGGTGGLIRTSGGDALGLAPPGPAGDVVIESGAPLTALPGGVVLEVAHGETLTLPGGTIDAGRIRVDGTLVLNGDSILRAPGPIRIGGTLRLRRGERDGANLTMLTESPLAITGTIDAAGLDGAQGGAAPRAGGRGGAVTIRTSSVARMVVPTVLARGGDADRNDTSSPAATFGGGRGGTVQVVGAAGEMVFAGAVLPAEDVDPLPPQPSGTVLPTTPVFRRGVLTTGGYGGLVEPLIRSGNGALPGAPGGAGGDIVIECTRGGRVRFDDVQLFTGGNVERWLGYPTAIQGGPFPRVTFQAPLGSLGGRGQDSVADCGGEGGPGGDAGRMLLVGCSLDPAPASVRASYAPLFHLTDWTVDPLPVSAPIVEALDAGGRPVFTLQAFGGSGGLLGGSLKKTGQCSNSPLPCNGVSDCVCPTPGLCRIPPCQIVPFLGCVCPPPEPCLCLASIYPECPGTYGPRGADGAVTCDALAVPPGLRTAEHGGEPVRCVVNETCDDGNACTDGFFDPVRGCVHHPMPGRSCDDGNVCTSGDVCDDRGLCAGTAPGCPDDGNPCVEDVFDCTARACGVRVADHTPCPDDTFCNGSETCIAGACTPGTPVRCVDDANPCTLDACNEDGEGCGIPIPDGVACPDGLFCNGDEVCRGGACVAGTEVACSDDGDPCREPACDETADRCGIMRPDGTPCPDASVCNGIELCEGGSCRAGVALVCRDGNPCTADTCDDATGCTFPATAGVRCDDQNSCTVAERCSASGTCDGVALPEGTCCSDGDDCNGLEVCSGMRCVPGAALRDGAPCEDGQPCTRGERCEAGRCAGGSFTPDGATCDDRDVCTGNDRCVAGRCAGGAAATDGVACDDGNPCTADERCTFGRCAGAVVLPDATPCRGGCDGGRACSVGDKCVEAQCRGVAGPDADRDGLCDPVDQCPDDADCDDDGLIDGARAGSEDLDNDGTVDQGETDPRDADTDGDGLPDGLERGLTAPEDPAATDLGAGHFLPDLDPSTRTDPTNPDSDDDGQLDGQEDANRNGRVDPGESDPEEPSGCVGCSTTTSSTASTTRPVTTSSTIKICAHGPSGACDDGDPCTTDTCTPGGCVRIQQSGLDAVACAFDGTALRTPLCAGAVVPAVIDRRFAEAGLSVARAGMVGRLAKARRLVRKAAATLEKGSAAVRKAERRGKVSPGCSVALRAVLDDGSRRARRWLDGG